MTTYQNILVAVDLSSESKLVLQKAGQIAGPGADLHVVYVQEPMDNVYVGIVPQSAAFSGLGDLEAQLGEELKEKLGALGKEFGLPSECLAYSAGITGARNPPVCKGTRQPVDRYWHAWPKRPAAIAGFDCRFPRCPAMSCRRNTSTMVCSGSSALPAGSISFLPVAKWRLLSLESFTPPIAGLRAAWCSGTLR